MHIKARIFSKYNGAAMQTVSSKGRSFVNGKVLSNELRSLIVDKIISEGGNPLTGDRIPKSVDPSAFVIQR